VTKAVDKVIVHLLSLSSSYAELIPLAHMHVNHICYPTDQAASQQRCQLSCSASPGR